MEQLTFQQTDRTGRYVEFMTQWKALIAEEEDIISLLANTSAALKEAFGWWWIGFYLVKHEKLVLGPFQGPVACSTIGFGKGVCGTAWAEGKTIIVPDVHEFPGHIACSAASKSEIVIPIRLKNSVWGVLDIDSDKLSDFDDVDQLYLEMMCNELETHLNRLG